MKSLRASTSSEITSSARNTFNAIWFRRVRFSIFALVALVGLALYSGSHAAPFIHPGAAEPARNAKSVPAVTSSLFSQLAVETIATYAADCTTPKVAFNLGETVCAKTDGVTETDRFVNWCVACETTIDYGGQGITDIDPNNQPQNFSYTPTVTGLWKATIADPTDSSIIPATFTVINQTAPLATYAADCTTPKTDFVLGDVVCARAIGYAGSNNRFAWTGPENLVRAFTPITASPQTDLFQLPTTETELIDIFLVNNRGTWILKVLSGDNRQLEAAPFTVSGNPAADLSLSKGINGGSPDSGANYSYTITLTNFGPNAAADVALSDPQPVNATFVSVTQISGPTFACSGSNPVLCERSTLAAGDTASFEVTYTAGAAGSSVENIASVTSTTTELRPADNTASSGRVDIAGTPPNPTTCSLECPNSIIVGQNAPDGANVTFTAPETFGDCGTVTTSHASGSFFPTGTTTVTATSSVGGGSCTFTVTVIEAANPTISCPANQTVAAPSGSTEANVSVGSPTATGSGVTVTGIRDDEASVSDPYPVGTTLITWRATDEFGRSASCVQSITVTSTDAPTISCPSNKTFTAASGECTFTATAGQIGTPSSTGPGVTITSRRSDDLALTDPYPAGQTFITWTATNSVGAASCIQTITVNATDNQAPTLVVPPSITTSTDQCSVLLDEEQFVATAEDNCSSSVNISRTGMPQIACPVPGNPNRTCDSFVFPTGTTVITYTATDSAGNSTSGIQTVTVSENPNITPTIDAPQNLTFYTGPNASTCDTFVGDATLGTATASDNCPGVVVTRTGVPAGNVFPVGTTTITYRATDRVGNFAEDTQTVTVIDNTPPVISCPADITTGTDPGLCSALVNPGTATATDNCDSNPTIVGTRSDSQPLNAPYPKGTTTITWTATDHATPTNNQSSCTQTITVVDDEAPVITTNGLTPLLFPANHAYHTFNVTDFVIGVSDNCDALGVSDVVIQQVTSDEVENGDGDGDTFNDIVIAADCKSVQVRAERRNSGDGRVYTITFQVTDSAGNVGTKTSTVHSPKNLGVPVVDSGPQYTVTGTCP